MVDRSTARALPTGTVTFLFTDIEGSTRLLSDLGDEYQPLLEAHARILRTAIAENDGVEVNTEGDAFFAVFASPAGAIATATSTQTKLAAQAWPEGTTVRVRMGIHSGEGRLGGDDYIGMDVHRAARIASAAHGGQVLISEATRGLLGKSGSTVLRDLGTHELKDLDAPERIYQLLIANLPSDFPPPRAKRPGNVPEPATSFIGRQEVVAQIEAMLEQSRLVTIIGPGGMGKTRLALRVAADLAGSTPDGAFFVPLDTLREPDLLATTIASTIGLSAADESPLDVLKTHLADRSLLLVLDNFEQISSASGVVDELLRSAPGLRVLATSQHPLGLYGEHELPAPPLATPDPSASPTVSELGEYEAVALFVARAQAARPHFDLDERNSAAIAEIVSRLDGLPLAIELAAARIKLLTPQAILDRLEKRLDLLSSSAKNIPERQRTLRGAIDWSYGLLDEEEQHVFDRIGVFAGGFDFEAAEELVNPADECGVDLFDALGSLVEKSLLRQAEVADQPRFSQLESIRQYALDHLEARGESGLMQRRLAEHIARLAESAERFLDRSDDQGWFARLDTEQNNLRAALRWSLAEAEMELAQRIAGSVWRFWVRKGLLAEGTFWTEEVIGLVGEQSAQRAKLLLAQGSLAYWRGDYDAAAGPYEAALETYRSLADEAGVTNAAYNLGYAQMYMSDADMGGARKSFEDALSGFRSAGDDAMTQSTLFTLGYIDQGEGELDRAEGLFREALEMKAGDVRPWTGLATVAYNRGDYADARRWLRELVEETKGMPDLAFRIVQLDLFTSVEVADGNFDLGMRLHGQAGKLREDIGGGPPRDPSIKADAEAAARAAIGDQRTDEALAAGRALDGDAAIAMAVAGEPFHD